MSHLRNARQRFMRGLTRVDAYTLWAFNPDRHRWH